MILFFFSLFSAVSCEAADTDGWIAGTGLVGEDYRISQDSVTDAKDRIERHIRADYPNRSESGGRVSTSDLAFQIAKVAECFQLDPYIFTALIEQESKFDPFDPSHTGAIGLTQFTRSATREVNHQLGEFGTDQASRFAIDYYQGVIQSSCIRDELNGGNAFTPLYERTNSEREMLSILKRDSIASLVYGAIYLKLSLSLVQNGYGSGCRDPYVTTAMSHAIQIQRKGVMKYNAAGCSEQQNHVHKIMDVFYPRIIE